MFKDLSPEELAHLDSLVNSQMSLGLVSYAKEFYSGQIKLDEEKYLKVNLPYTKARFASGNGEGIWACPVTSEDEVIYKTGSRGDTFDVYVLNDCVIFPFQYASVIKVMVTGTETRPILDYDWISATINKASNGSVCFDDMLESDND